jgi:hypothetical protein
LRAIVEPARGWVSGHLDGARRCGASRERVTPPEIWPRRCSLRCSPPRRARASPTR